MARQTARTQTDQRRLGRSSGGGLRAYGYEKQRENCCPMTKPPLSVECARRVLAAGEHWPASVRDLRARGVQTTQGNPWQVRTLQSMLDGAPYLRPTASIEGRIVADAVWPAIITPEPIPDRLRRLLRAPARNTRGAPSRYLLTGLLRCAVCGGRSHRPRPIRLALAPCATTSTARRSRPAAVWTDEYIRDAVLHRIGRHRPTRTGSPGRVAIDPKLAEAIEGRRGETHSARRSVGAGQAEY